MNRPPNYHDYAKVTTEQLKQRIAFMRQELNSLNTNAPSEIAGWLRALCRRIHAECDGRGVGVIGMCLTGNLVGRSCSTSRCWCR